MPSEKGQSLIEVIVTAAVGILVVSALVFATIFSLRNANFAKNSAQATKLAQEGIERVRTGRDRNSSIIISGVDTVDSWSSTGKPIWGYQIKTSGGCENITVVDSKCYFNVGSDGSLSNTASGFAYVSTTSAPLPSDAESITSAGREFHRIVILSDDGSYQNQKMVTVLVTWTDFTGSHESRLTTILRKI